LADAGEFEKLTKRINGGLIGLEDRKARYDRVLAVGN
jgi:predicted chitinase